MNNAKDLLHGRQDLAGALPIENRVASVFLHVTDLRQSAEWYSRLLGVPLLEERLNVGPVYWLELEGTHLILDSNTANRQDPDWREEMKPRFMIPARDIDEAYEYVKGKTVPYFEPERHGSMAYFNFPDPEGQSLMACWTSQEEEGEPLPSRSPIRPKIGGVFVDVIDMPTVARWYCELFGLPLDEEETAQPLYSVPVTKGAALLLDRNRHMKGEDFTEICYFLTDDFEAALAYIQEQGFEIGGQPNYFPDLSEVALLDPDGNRILVVQIF